MPKSKPVEGFTNRQRLLRTWSLPLLATHFLDGSGNVTESLTADMLQLSQSYSSSRQYSSTWRLALQGLQLCTSLRSRQGSSRNDWPRCVRILRGLLRQAQPELARRSLLTYVHGVLAEAHGDSVATVLRKVNAVIWSSTVGFDTKARNSAIALDACLLTEFLAAASSPPSPSAASTSAPAPISAAELGRMSWVEIYDAHLRDSAHHRTATANSSRSESPGDRHRERRGVGSGVDVSGAIIPAALRAESGAWMQFAAVRTLPAVSAHWREMLDAIAANVHHLWESATTTTTTSSTSREDTSADPDRSFCALVSDMSADVVRVLPASLSPGSSALLLLRALFEGSQSPVTDVHAEVCAEVSAVGRVIVVTLLKLLIECGGREGVPEPVLCRLWEIERPNCPSGGDDRAIGDHGRERDVDAALAEVLWIPVVLRRIDCAPQSASTWRRLLEAPASQALVAAVGMEKVVAAYMERWERCVLRV